MRSLFLMLFAAALAACAARATPTPTAPPTQAPLTAAVLPSATGVPPMGTPTGAPAIATQPAAETPAVAAAALLVVQQPDDTVALVTVDGETLPLSAAPATTYALANLTGSPGAPRRVYALGPEGAAPVEFIAEVSSGFAAWTDLATGAARLAWDHYEAAGGVVSEIFVSDAEGVDVRLLVEEAGSDRVLRVLGWSPGGETLYYSREPLGLGGYILFAGFSDLWAYDWASGETRTVVPEAAAGPICLDDFAAVTSQVAHHCTAGQISVLDLNLGITSAVLPPAEVAGEAGVMGNARFGPAEDRVAFSLARGAPDAEQGWVAVSDGLAGAARLIATAEPGDYFDVIDWLDAETLLLQSYGAAPGVWLVGADGSNLRRVAEGLWLSTL